jgi:acyl-CoA synthetase (AMP-forming)/AMP-acid ligase II
MAMNLGSILTWQARKYRDKVFMICDEQRITYGELNSKVNCLANGLISLGISKGDKVVTLFYNSVEVVETYFALLKIGAVCVPLNYRLKGNELQYIIDHSDAKAMIFSGDFTGVIEDISQGLKKTAIYITTSPEPMPGTLSYQELIRSHPAEEPERVVAMDDESVILYTSGTTGRPKGVVLTHENQFLNTTNYALAYCMKDWDIELALTPMFHSSTLGRIITYVFSGCTFITSKRFDPSWALRTIEREKITSITQAPTMYVAMINLKNAGRFDTSSVRRVVTGAAPMSVNNKKALKELFPKAGLFDLYGLTEASPGVSILEPDRFFEKIESVGKPMVTVEVKVVDEKGIEVHRGKIGEIICRGPNVMKGYYKDPRATSEALRDGWLYTGDLGKMDEDGFLYLTDRKKDLIISGGENIYPAEIERILLEHPKILEAAVIGVPDPYWGERVKAFVVLKPGEQLSPEEVIMFCEEHLASYKKPKEVEFIDKLPRNAANKVMKEELKNND